MLPFLIHVTYWFSLSSLSRNLYHFHILTSCHMVFLLIPDGGLIWLDPVKPVFSFICTSGLVASLCLQLHPIIQTNCLLYGWKPELFILGIALFFSMWIYCCPETADSGKGHLLSTALPAKLPPSHHACLARDIALRWNVESTEFFFPFSKARQCQCWHSLLVAVRKPVNTRHRDWD